MQRSLQLTEQEYRPLRKTGEIYSTTPKPKYSDLNFVTELTETQLINRSIINRCTAEPVPEDTAETLQTEERHHRSHEQRPGPFSLSTFLGSIVAMRRRSTNYHIS